MSLVNRMKEQAEKKIVNFKYVSENFFKVESSDSLLYEHLYEHFKAHPPNFFHMPKYRAGIWDGYIRFFDKMRRTLPIGIDTTGWLKKTHALLYLRQGMIRDCRGRLEGQE